MKAIFITILSIFTLQLVAQTNLDSLLFNKVNDYRISNGLNLMEWDDSVYNMSNHHSSYLCSVNKDDYTSIAGHNENKDIPDFEEINTPSERFKKYVNQPFSYNGENVGFVTKNTKFTDEQMVSVIFEDWKNSEKHNKAMLKPDAKFGACSVYVLNKKFPVKYKETIKMVSMKKGFATFNFYY